MKALVIGAAGKMGRAIVPSNTPCGICQNSKKTVRKGCPYGNNY